MARNTEPTDTAIVDDSVETLPEDEAATSDTVIAVYDVNAVIAALGRPGKEADKGLYAGIVSDELVAACNEDGPTYAVSQTLRNEFGQPKGNVWTVAPTLDPGQPVPGEYRLVDLVVIARGE